MLTAAPTILLSLSLSRCACFACQSVVFSHYFVFDTFHLLLLFPLQLSHQSRRQPPLTRARSFHPSRLRFKQTASSALECFITTRLTFRRRNAASGAAAHLSRTFNPSHLPGTLVVTLSPFVTFPLTRQWVTFFFPPPILGVLNRK